MLRRTILTVGFVMAILRASARAGTLTTPIIYKGTASAYYACEAVDVGKKAVNDLTITLVAPGGSGTPVSCGAVTPVSICGDYEAASFSNGAFCRVTFGGSNQNVRAAISVLDGSNNIVAIMPAN